MNAIRSAAIVSVVGVAVAVSACGKKEEQPPPNNPSTINGTGMPPGADPVPSNTTTTPAPAGSTAPAAGGVTGTAQVIDPSLAAAATTVLGGLASTNAPGASPVGVVMAGNFQQGQTLEQTLNMEPGKCYTVVGSSIGVQQLDATATAVTPLPGLSPQFGSATGKAGVAGSQVVMGPKDKCLKLALSPIAVPMKVTITAAKGAGLAAAQIYAK